MAALAPEAVERDVAALSRSLGRAVKAFAGGGGHEGVQAVAVQLQEQVAAFAPLLPLLAALRAPGMRDRHWEELSTALGVRVHPDGAPAAAAAAKTKAGGGSSATAHTPLPLLPSAAAAGEGTPPFSLSTAVGLGLSTPAALETVTHVSERAGREVRVDGVGSGAGVRVGEWR